MIELLGYQLTYVELGILGLVGLLIGMSKTGIHGAGMMAVPLLAIIFGGKSSSGVMLPILIVADIFGVAYYHRHAVWTHLIKLLPWTLAGIILGTYIGDFIDDGTFRSIMAIIVLLSVVIMIWLEVKKVSKLPENPLIAPTLGIAAGFTTMVGNLAGSVMALYLLAMRMPKNEFIGTAAWFFMIVNWAKVPFHIFSWHSINFNSVGLSLMTIPAIALGAWFGIMLTKKISNTGYRYFIIVMTVIAAFLML
jgi:uncharacterized membrane protein YfcA